MGEGVSDDKHASVNSKGKHRSNVVHEVCRKVRTSTEQAHAKWSLGD